MSGSESNRRIPLVSDGARDTDRSEPLAERLRPLSSPAVLGVADGEVWRCSACAHRCVVAEGRSGACGVRFVSGGVLRAPRGYVARWYVRPIETNTVYHVLPGALALTFGMFGCDLRCPYCHNWNVSQALREGRNDEVPQLVDAEDIADGAVASGCRAVCAAYNEPMIAAEWVREVFSACKDRGLTTVIVSDGNTTAEALEHVRPVTDVFRVDLKATDAEQYRVLGGRLAPVIDGIRLARDLGFWVEVVTLAVPGFNDNASGMRRMVDTLVSIDPAIPWHVNAFQPRYRMRDRPPADAGMLTSLAGMGYARGLRYVYVGNVHDVMPELEHTRCPRCQTTVIERANYRVRTGGNAAVPGGKRMGLVDGRCAACGEAIDGLWEAKRLPTSAPTSCAEASPT